MSRQHSVECILSPQCHYRHAAGALTLTPKLTIQNVKCYNVTELSCSQTDKQTRVETLPSPTCDGGKVYI